MSVFVRYGPKVYFAFIGEEGGSGRLQLGRLDVGKARKRVYFALRVRSHHFRFLL